MQCVRDRETPTALGPTLLFLGIFLEEISLDGNQKTCTKIFIVALFIRVINVEILKCPSTGLTIQRFTQLNTTQQ